ncbi:hypothetical protein MPTK2_3g25000 [Marchantia polymorpha subsp. ruderalis]
MIKPLVRERERDREREGRALERSSSEAREERERESFRGQRGEACDAPNRASLPGARRMQTLDLQGYTDTIRHRCMIEANPDSASSSPGSILGRDPAEEIPDSRLFSCCCFCCPSPEPSLWACKRARTNRRGPIDLPLPIDRGHIHPPARPIARERVLPSFLCLHLITGNRRGRSFRAPASRTGRLQREVDRHLEISERGRASQPACALARSNRR